VISNGARGWSVAAKIFILIGATLLTVQIIKSQMGFFAVRAGSADLGYMFAPSDSDVLARKAASDLVGGNIADAATLSKASLRRSPINQIALRTLGQAQDKSKQDTAAARSMTLAGRLGWRDTPLSGWLMLHLAMKGDLNGALRQADALARREQSPEATYAVFYAAMTDKSTRSILADRLALQPTWRGAFFNGTAKLPETQFDGLEILLREVYRRRSPVTREEVMPYINHLVASGRFNRARSVWSTWGHVGVDAALTPYDPNFTTVALNDRIDRAVAPFEWVVTAESQDRVIVDGSNGMTVAPSVDGEGSTIVSQLMTLSPGHYSMTFELANSPPNVVSWSMLCRPSNELVLIPISKFKDRILGKFVIPSAGCAGQMLALRTRGQADTLRIGKVRIAATQ
jgi:hypothetical protein